MTGKEAMMNPVIEAINNRMSIRSYKPGPIPKDVINTIIEAGNQAPSSGTDEEGSKEFLFQPWRFVVVEDPEFRQRLVQTALPFWQNMIESLKETRPEIYEKVMMQYEAMPEPKDMVYYSAPVILFVIGPAGEGEDVSCALACENIMIAATSLGLGSCYVGFGAMVTGNADVVQALELKDDERIYGPIVLGYPKDEPSALDSIRPKKKVPMIKWI